MPAVQAFNFVIYFYSYYTLYLKIMFKTQSEMQAMPAFVHDSRTKLGSSQHTKIGIHSFYN